MHAVGDPVAGRNGGLVRRVDDLEQEMAAFRAAFSDQKALLQRLELEQGHVREMIGARFQALDRGQELVGQKIDALAAAVNLSSSDPSGSPSGRMLMERLSGLAKDVESDRQKADGDRLVQDRKMTDLTALADQLKGALWLAQVTGWGSALVAGASFLYTLLRKGA